MGVLSKRADDAAAAELAANVVGYALGVAPNSIVDDARGCSQTAYARQLAMYLCHVAFELSLSRVASAFGRDRSTVAHACHAIEDQRDEDQFDLWLASLEAMMRAAPARSLRARL
ncbi:MAG: helix-turn-helix domain-containing protein [Hyphomonadaceae bacterium]